MPPCWGCEPLLSDPSLYADLRRLSEDEKGSLTCQYLGLTTGCCLTLTFIFPIVLLILFGLMRLRPAFIVLSLIVLPPMCFFLSWVMFIEFLRCVVAWFVLVSGWLIGTVLYALRRRHKYKANWLQRNPDDDDTRPADLVSSAIASRSRVTEGLGDMFASESSPGAGRRSSRASSEASLLTPPDLSKLGGSPGGRRSLRDRLNEKWDDVLEMREEQKAQRDGRGAAGNSKKKEGGVGRHGPTRGLLPLCFLAIITLRTVSIF